MTDRVRHWCPNVNKGNKMSRMHSMLLPTAQSFIPLYLKSLGSTVLSRRKEEFKLGWVMSLRDTIELVEAEG